MYVRFLQPVARYAAGDIDEFDDEVARGFVNTKQAEPSTAGAWMAASRASELAAAEARFAAKLEEVVGKLTAGRGLPSGPPTGGVNVGRLGDQKPVEDQEKRSLTEAMRCIFISQARGAPPELADYARKRLRGYADEFTEYKVNPSNGQLESVVTRQLDGGGLETITRTGTDSLGGGATYGFTLKPTFIPNLFKIAREAQVFADGTRSIPVTEGNEAIWPLLDQFKSPTVLNGIPQSAVFGGITLSFLGETSTRISSDAATRENRFKIVDLTGATDYSRDYIVDNYIAMDSEVTAQFAEAMAWIEDWTFIRGDGVAKPQGYFNANAAITSGPNSGSRTTSNQIDVADLIWMISKLTTMCWKNARWITNVTTFPYLAILKSSGTPVFQPNAMINQSELFSIMAGSKVDEAKLVSRPMGTMLGFPVYFSEKVPVLGTTGDISLVCPYQYGNAQRQSIEIGVSEHFYFSTDRIAYRFKKRFYGRSLWPAAYTQADNVSSPSSGTQVSPFVVLHS